MRRAVFLIALLTAQLAWAHGAIHEQIRALEARIARAPGDAELYLHRGRLYLEDRHFEEASRDFRRALELDPRLRAAHYFCGDALLKSGDAAGAEREARAFLSSLGVEDRGGLMRGYRLLGQSLAAQGRPAEAAEACRSALGQADEPDPALYRECADNALAAGQSSEALRILDAGISRLGSLTVLEERAIEIELTAGHTDGALARLDQLAAAGPGRERWLAQKGEILETAGRTAEARQAFEAALAAIRALPPGRRKTRSLIRLEQEVLRSLGAPPPEAPARSPGVSTRGGEGRPTSLLRSAAAAPDPGFQPGTAKDGRLRFFAPPPPPTRVETRVYVPPPSSGGWFRAWAWGMRIP